jgi:FkbM family methyltransferase
MSGTFVSYYSQFGEDRILDKLFQGKSQGVCVEVGANNGVDGSTTLHFEELGWDCILVEPNPMLCRELRERRKARLFECAASSATGTAILHVAVGAEQSHVVSALGDELKPAQILKEHGFRTEPVEVAIRRLDDILDEARPQGIIDFISIDVEGHELELLKGFSLDRWRPVVLIIEDNSPMWESAVADHLRGQGYVRFRRTGVNDWYAHVSHPELASPGRRLAYYPSMLFGRALMSALKIATPIAPILLRLPGARPVGEFLLGRRRSS